MNIKNFVGKFFRFKKGFIIGMFENSLCYGLGYKEDKGLRFIGYNFTDDEIYSAILQQDYLIDTRKGRDYWIVDSVKGRELIKQCLTVYHNYDSFRYVEEEW